MSTVRIKICGLTRVEDVKSAIEAGADAVGFVFTKSPRRISVETAIRLVDYVSGDVLRVGLFLNQDRSEIAQVVNSVPLDILQFHGSETERECSAFGLPWLKAVAMENAQSARQAERDFPNAMGLLLDSHTAGRRGGSGRVFDWSLSSPVSKPVWLAGGLNAENVARAISIVRPFAVDVSSGVEASPGIKDASRIMAFVNAVRKVETESSEGN
ncbi:MAG: phosphoribosylanthranilate isomerase [Gammaproteobacteria bacterium]|nr:phosphoribosylanthranilate isomerase [Gammaproteobacteria bacterium]